MARQPALHLLVVTPGAARPSAPVVRALVNPAAVARITVLTVAPPPHRDPLFRLGSALGIGMSQGAVDHLVRSNEGAAWAAARRAAADLSDWAPRVQPAVRTGPPVDQVLAVADEEQVDLIVVAGDAFPWWPTMGSGADLAAEIVRRAARPVLVLPDREEDVSWRRGRRARGPAVDWRRLVAAWRRRPAPLGAPGLPA